MSTKEELEAEIAALRRQLSAAEDPASRVEAEASEMYENANSQLTRSLEGCQERIAQLERENGTLALALSYLRAQLAKGDDQTVDVVVPQHAAAADDDRRTADDDGNQ